MSLRETFKSKICGLFLESLKEKIWAFIKTYKIALSWFAMVYCIPFFHKSCGTIMFLYFIALGTMGDVIKGRKSDFCRVCADLEFWDVVRHVALGGPYSAFLRFSSLLVTPSIFFYAIFFACWLICGKAFSNLIISKLKASIFFFCLTTFLIILFYLMVSVLEGNTSKTFFSLLHSIWDIYVTFYFLYLVKLLKFLISPSRLNKNNKVSFKTFICSILPHLMVIFVSMIGFAYFFHQLIK